MMYSSKRKKEKLPKKMPLLRLPENSDSEGEKESEKNTHETNS